MNKATSSLKNERKIVFQYFLPCRIKAINEKSIRLLADTHERIGISTPEFGIMVVLAENKDVSSRDISKTTGMDKATITRALDRLTEKKLILRSKSKQDNRLIKISLTALGKRTFTEIEEIALVWERDFLKGVKLTELNKFYSTLNKLDENLAWMEKT